MPKLTAGGLTNRDFWQIGEGQGRSGTHRASRVSIFKVASHCPKIDPRWTHEYVPLAALLVIFWHAKDFQKGQPRGHIYVSIGGQIQHNVRPP